MTIAWRKLADVPEDDARPWLIATARNLLAGRPAPACGLDGGSRRCGAAGSCSLASVDIDAELEVALRALSSQDLEALLLIAWEDLTPAAAAASLGITPAAFRVGCIAPGAVSSTHSNRTRKSVQPPTEPGAAMSTDRLLDRIRAANPAPAAETVTDRDLFDRIVGQPGRSSTGCGAGRAGAGCAGAR